MDARAAKGETLVSREALDHLCGLSVESGLKYLMITRRLVTADRDGDFPADASNRRPHINELWDVFMAKAGGREGTALLRDLGGADQLKVFQTWSSQNRYAADDTVRAGEVRPRLDFFKRLRGVVAQEGA